VIAVDTNVLIYADREEMPFHAKALAVLRGLAEGSEACGVPVFCVGEFVRVVSHPRVFDPPTPPAEAMSSVEALLSSPATRLLTPGPRFVTILRALLEASGAAGNLVFDAQIAAVCLECGVGTLITEDRDFSRFPGIRVQPLTTYAPSGVVAPRPGGGRRKRR
jgi:uncharacterized protein